MDIHGNHTEELHPDDFTPYISMIVLAILSLVINCVVFFVIARHKELRRRISNKFVLNLTVSNSCVALAMLISSSYFIGLNNNEHTSNNHSEPAPEISLMFGVLLLLSVMNMILLSADRLFAVKWTFTYFQITSKRKVNIAIIFPWIITLVYFTVLVILLQTGTDLTRDTVTHVIYFSFDIIALIGFITLVVSNMVIYKETQGQLTHMRRNSVVDSSRKRNNEKTFNLRERRLAFINIGLVMKFVIFWLPILGSMNYHLIWEMSTSVAVEYLSFHLVLANCLCDPTVYVMLSKDIRKAVQRLLSKMKRSSESIQSKALKGETDELELDSMQE